MSSVETTKNKLPYPKASFFIIINEFCERFSYYGMRGVLALYFTNSLLYDTNTSTILYHVFAMLCYVTPLFGATIADSFFGKFKTIFYLSVVYACGNVILSIGAIPTLQIPHETISLLGLLFIAIGTGGIKPCVSSFGGDQFVLPQQSTQLQQFFSIFYFSINAGAMISTVITPIMRNDVKCFGEDDCFSLAFGVPAIIMCSSLVIFVMGKPLYRIKQPDENPITAFFMCVSRALRNKITGKNSSVKKSNWLEYANDKYTDKQISDFQSVLSILYLFIPLPLYWALFDQQGSRWIYQATQMDGRIFGFTLKPDQTNLINPLLVLILIPIFEWYVYPILRKIGVQRPLQKLVIGGWLAVLTFIISALVEYKLQDSYGVVPVNGEAQLRIFNSLECNITLNPPIQNKSTIKASSALELLHIPTTSSSKHLTNFSVDSTCPFKLNIEEVELKYYEKQALSYFITRTSSDIKLVAPTNPDNVMKDTDGRAKIRIFLGSLLDNKQEMMLTSVRHPEEKYVFRNSIGHNSMSDFFFVPPGRYNLVFESKIVLSHIDIGPSEIDTIIIRQNSSSMDTFIVNMMPPNNVHMLWQLPQITMLTFSEILFSITGLEFSFTQAPSSMKTILSAAWLLTVSGGNLIVVIISKMKFVDSQVYEFLLFAGLMSIDMIVLMILSMRYKYAHIHDNPDESTDSQCVAGEPKSQMTSISSIND